ncbi:MAG: hypothetical protein PHS82_06540 [Lachnospiraceae bacterium]|nr:hypothetical protein [Lachnospiraceae bacterium]
MKGLYDVHCHILAGIDDGAANKEVAKRMLQSLYNDGVTNIIVTPHFRGGYYTPDKDKIDNAIGQLRELTKLVSEEMQIYPGCEIFWTSHSLERLQNKQIYSMAGSFYALAEFLPSVDYRQIHSSMYELQCAGYTPIVAHAERCECLFKYPEHIEELVRMGACIQMNAGSIAGKGGLTMKWFCKKIMKKNLLHFVGTDAHDVGKRAPNMGECAKVMSKTMGEAYTKKILISNPSKIVRNEML